MKKLKRKLTTLAMATMVALTAVMPASASTIEYLSVDGGYFTSSDYATVIGKRVRIHIINEGDSDAQPIFYQISGVESSFGTWGYIYPYGSPQEVASPIPGTWEFIREYDHVYSYYPGFTSDAFDLQIECGGSSYDECKASATIEVLE